MSKNRPRIGLALGAGSARGFAHLGVLKVLDEAEIPIDVIAGTSIGSICGALYASGNNINYVIKLAENLRQQLYTDLSVPKWGLVKGNKIEELLKLLTKSLNFEDLKIPLYVVAVDIEKGEEVVFSEGAVYEAVRASISIPGIFEPKRLNQRLLVDGAVLNCVPVDIIEEKGVDLSIATEVKYGGVVGKEKNVTNIFDVLLHSIDLMQLETVIDYSQRADVLIQPDLSHINPARFDNISESIQLGIEAAEKSLPEIKNLLENEERKAARNNK